MIGKNNQNHCNHTFLVWNDEKIAVCSACELPFPGKYDPARIGHFGRAEYQAWIRPKVFASTSIVAVAPRIYLDDDFGIGGVL